MTLGDLERFTLNCGFTPTCLAPV